MKIALVGGTGRTGRRLVEQALQRGHTVRALVRTQPASGPRLNPTWVRGDIDDLKALTSLIEGCEVVISAIGPSAGRKKDTCSTSTSNLIKVGAQRLIVVSGMGLDLPQDRKSLVHRIAAGIVRLLSPEVYADKARELAVLQSSGIKWTAARVGALMDGDELPINVDRLSPRGFRVTTGSLAAFCLDEADASNFVGQAPFVTN